MSKTNEQEEKAKVKVENKPSAEQEMHKAEKAGNRAPMYKGPQMMPGNKRAAVKRRY